MEASRRGKTIEELLAENSGPGFFTTAFRTLVGLLLVAALLVGIFFAASAIEGDAPEPRAPWTQAGAPDVVPSVLDKQ